MVRGGIVREGGREKKRMIRAVLRGGMGCWLMGWMARLVVVKGKRKGGSR